jgi:sterol desaturase/sphingolipid hydroxylase (fatty acid hydroxylase superfamily)
LEATLVVLAAAAGMMILEAVAPRRRWPNAPGWIRRAILLNAAQVGVVFLTGVTWDRWFPQLRLWDLTDMHTVAAALIGYLIITFAYYWWHRARHEVPFLWRWFHQVHHSPQRIEIITSFYKHPFELIVNGALSSFLLFGVAGVGPAAGALAVTITGLAELFYHWNVKTPYWLGFFFQRPESHCVHHRAGWHRSNYADLPLWDMLFGTFDNPRRCEAACGFEAERETLLPRMLLGRDVNTLRDRP